jgi:hypothetical protein
MIPCGTYLFPVPVFTFQAKYAAIQPKRSNHIERCLSSFFHRQLANQASYLSWGTGKPNLEGYHNSEVEREGKE